MSPEEEVFRGGKAREVLESAIFLEAKQRVIDGINAKMRTVPLTEERMHTRLIMLLQAWNSLEAYLEQVKETGKMADFQIEDQKRKLRFFG